MIIIKLILNNKAWTLEYGIQFFWAHLTSMVRFQNRSVSENHRYFALWEVLWWPLGVSQLWWSQTVVNVKIQNSKILEWLYVLNICLVYFKILVYLKHEDNLIGQVNSRAVFFRLLLLSVLQNMWMTTVVVWSSNLTTLLKKCAYNNRQVLETA